MSASHLELYVHLVWATSGRRPSISESIEPALFAAIADKCRKLGCPPIAIGGLPDHVHVLAALSPTVTIATLAKEIKGASAHLVTHRLAPDAPFRWQSGYGAFTLRKDDVPTVRDYVLRQKDRHASRALHADWEPQTDG